MPSTFDALTRTVAQTRSRREALKALGAFTVTAALGGLGLGFAGAPSPTPPRGAARSAGACSEDPFPGLPDFCSDNGYCICFTTSEGERTCAELPMDFCGAPTCTSTSDCAALGPDAFCAGADSGFCDDAVGRCLVPCGYIDWSGTWVGTSTLDGEQVTARFDITDVEDGFSGRAYVADPISGEFVDVGPFSGGHQDVLATWRTSTDLVIAGTFSGDQFTGTITFPDFRSHPAFSAPLSLVRTGSVSDEPGTPHRPEAVALGAPFPNPARAGAAVTIPVEVATPAPLRVVVFDALGREVAVLHDGPAAAGHLRLALGASLPAGVYTVRATAGASSLTRALTLVR